MIIENITYQNLWDTVKVVNRRKFIVNANLKRRKAEIN